MTPRHAAGEKLHTAAAKNVSVSTRPGARDRGRVRRALGRFKGAGWALADQCVVSATNFFTIYLLARHLSTAAFGAFTVAYTGLLLLTSMQNALVIQPHNVLGAGLPLREYQRFTAAVAVLQAMSCLGVCAVLGAIGWLIAHMYSPATGSILMALAVAAVPWMGQEFVRRVLYTRGESHAAAKNDVVSYGLQLVGTFMLAVYWTGRATPEAALYVLGGSSVAGILMGLWQLRDHVCFGTGDPGSSFGRKWAEVWHFGKWLTGQNMLQWFGAQGHVWIIGVMLGAEQVGLYRAATHLVNVMNPLRQAAYSYLPSRGSLAYQAGGGSGLSRWVRKTLWILLAFLVPFFIVLVGFPGWVLSIAYGERYAVPELALILALSAIVQCITFSKFPFDIGLLALRATKSIFYVHLIPVILLFTVGIALIHFLGILGAPLSSIVISSVLLFSTWLAYARRSRREASVRPGHSDDQGKPLCRLERDR